ncbi:undecaprenyl-diphosphatase [Kitasatospora sp. SolWspMP-SS2h]|uniref:phosphatase PAP2 family protein n=1 Tax=Kitasatospora sp. SolWspMP-SS2h TaxID=1305729 RepID=UPI000DB9B925|nr:phosphatase PAP2 family protein [Kitasatospora sp. SolWspMP-SS2h]RAJ44161.1 undecaprenyl-diphosphatase [Kitasatospora sp. SolWspMP-SS2h]
MIPNVPLPADLLAYDGSGIDGGLYTRVTGWAESAPHWFEQLTRAWSAYGMAVFALLMLWAWWRARAADSAVMARVLASPLIVVAAYLVNSVLKSLVEEVRPCRQLPGSFVVESCAPVGDWSFPSNHTVAAFSAAAALWYADRRIGWVALLAAVLMGASRVWVGAHYPHDVLAAALLGVLVAVPLALLAGRAAPLVDRLRTGPLGPVLGAGAV